MTEIEQMKAAHDYFTQKEWVLIAKSLKNATEAQAEINNIIGKMPLKAVAIAGCATKETMASIKDQPCQET